MLYVLMQGYDIPDTRVDIEAVDWEVVGVYSFKSWAEKKQVTEVAALVLERQEEASVSAEEAAKEIADEYSWCVQEFELDT